MIERRRTKQIKVGNTFIGSDHQISVQTGYQCEADGEKMVLLQITGDVPGRSRRKHQQGIENQQTHTGDG